MPTVRRAADPFVLTAHFATGKNRCADSNSALCSRPVCADSALCNFETGLLAPGMQTRCTRTAATSSCSRSPTSRTNVTSHSSTQAPHALEQPLHCSMVTLGGGSSDSVGAAGLCTHSQSQGKPATRNSFFHPVFPVCPSGTGKWACPKAPSSRRPRLLSRWTSTPRRRPARRRG